jgi:hypothetical protein
MFKCLLAVLYMAGLTLSCAAMASGGVIQQMVGDVQFAMGTNPAQQAVKNDVITADMLVTTGKNSFAVLKFADGQIVVMQANSTFKVREYRYQPQQASENNMVFAMLRGGFRFVTGLIGQHNKQAFTLTTPNATIGIRGTDFMVEMSDQAMFSQVSSGGIELANTAGSLTLSAGQVALTSSASTLTSLTSLAALPAGIFTQLNAIPLVAPIATPLATTPNPVLANASGQVTSVGSTSTTAAGGAAVGGASVATGTSASAAATTLGVSSTSIAIGAGVAAGVAVVARVISPPKH